MKPSQLSRRRPGADAVTRIRRRLARVILPRGFGPLCTRLLSQRQFDVSARRAGVGDDLLFETEQRTQAEPRPLLRLESNIPARRSLDHQQATLHGAGAATETFSH